MTAAGTRPGASQWVSWLVGIAALAAVVAVAAQLSEERAFVALLERAEPRWLLLAAALQAATYAAQGEVWREVLRRAGRPWGLRRAYTVSVAKLFVDQALPSLGVSGGALVLRAMAGDRIPRQVATTVVAIDTRAFYLAYALNVTAALAILALKGHATPLVLAASTLLLLLGLAVTVTLVRLAGRPGHAAPAAPDVSAAPAAGARAPGDTGPRGAIGRVVTLLRGADPDMLRDRRLAARTTAWQALVALLDAATLWTLVRATGHVAPFADVFAAFMLASLLRSFGFVPGGLGTFEAAAVGALAAAGLPLPVALSATLLFRGLSFWLPMLPGFVASRRAVRGDVEAG